MLNFAAIDFETANGSRTSVCSVGVVIVRDGDIVDSIYRIIKPEPNHYMWFCQKVHGMSDKDTCCAPTFPEVWLEIAPLIGDLPLVAHNAAFDEGCLRSVFEHYGMNYPMYKFHCTFRASKKAFGAKLPNHQLPTVSSYCGFNLANHHNALSDAEACAHIALRIL